VIVLGEVTLTWVGPISLELWAIISGIPLVDLSIEFDTHIVRGTE
jgi:hypothetical protein